MTTKEALEKIRAMFNTEAAKPTDYKLSNGTTLMVNGDLAEGAQCVLKDAKGNVSTAPDADYDLEDGTVLAVASGIITAIKAPAGTDASTASDNSATGNTATDMKKLKEDFAKISASFESLKQELEAFRSADRTFKDKVEEGFRLVSKLPAAEPTEKPKNTFRSELHNKEQQRLRNISQALSQLR